MRTPVLLLVTAFCLVACTGKGPSQEELGTRHGDPAEKILLAYVFRMNELPDATYLTHINYAFGHVNDSFNGVRAGERRMLAVPPLHLAAPDDGLVNVDAQHRLQQRTLQSPKEN